MHGGADGTAATLGGSGKSEVIRARRAGKLGRIWFGFASTLFDIDDI